MSAATIQIAAALVGLVGVLMVLVSYFKAGRPTQPSIWRKSGMTAEQRRLEWETWRHSEHYRLHMIGWLLFLASFVVKFFAPRLFGGNTP